jgi:hypothetical protein
MSAGARRNAYAEWRSHVAKHAQPEHEAVALSQKKDSH